MKKIILILFILTNVLFSEDKVRLKEISRIQGVRSNQIMGIGLVIGLNGTGDKGDLTPQLMQNVLRYFGTEIGQSQINSSNLAAVMVTASLPPFKKMGDTIDISVSSINDAKSLEGGMLLYTELKGIDGKTYAVGQGSLTKVNNKTANKVNGFIPNGAIVETEVPFKLEYEDKIVIVLDNPDFTTSSRVADSINQRFSYDTAKSLDAARIEVKKTFTFGDDTVSFISAVENLEVEPDRKSVIVINEKTGTVILGEKISVAPIAISHGDISISIASQDDINSPDSGGGNGTGKSFYFKGTTVKDVVRMLNAIGATSDDIISIINSMKSAGAIDAEIKIM